MSNEEIAVFLTSRITHAVTSIGAGIALTYIWRCYYYRQHEKTKQPVSDFGLLWLAAAYLAWALLSIIQISEVLYHFHQNDTNYSLQFTMAPAFLSPINNAFFLCSFIYFEHGFSIVRNLKSRYRWFALVAGITFFSITVNLILVLTEQNQIARFVDFLYSSATLLFLGMLLIMAFNTRSLPGLSVLSLAVISASIFAQSNAIVSVLSKTACAFDPIVSATYEAIYLISHALLITLFISLAFTWIIEEEGIMDRFLKEGKIWDFYNKYRVNTNQMKTKLREQLMKGELRFALEILSLHFKEKKVAEKINEFESQLSSFSDLEERFLKKEIKSADWEARFSDKVKFVLDNYLDEKSKL